MSQELSQEQQKIILKVEKLLAMANRKKGNEEEAAVAAAKAQKMLTLYNLDMAMVEQGSSNSGKREDTQTQRWGVYLSKRFMAQRCSIKFLSLFHIQQVGISANEAQRYLER